MTRIIIKKGKEPLEVKKDSLICQCGLSKNQPYCDGFHKKVADESDNATFYYHDDKRVVVEEIRVKGASCASGCSGNCGDCGEN